jgi:hypothetical protein
MTKKAWGFTWRIAAVTLLSCGFNVAVAEVDQQIAGGDAALKRLDLDAALAHFRGAYQAEPGNYAATWKLAQALANKGVLTESADAKKQFYVEAEQLARAAVRLQPDDANGHTSLGIALGRVALFEDGKRKVELSKEVKTEAELAIKLDAKAHLAHHVLGVWNREMVALNRLLKTFAELLYGRFPAASLKTALQHLKQAMELRPDVLAHRVEYAITLRDADQTKTARAELDLALAKPLSWVTDPYYKTRAAEALEDLD